MEEHFNELTPAEHERLSLLMEESAEVIQIIGKILRHGYDRYNPDVVKHVDNRMLLTKELGHVRLALQLMFDAEDLYEPDVEDSARLKNLKVGKWLHHQEIEED
jgi:hypothetical protein